MVFTRKFAYLTLNVACIEPINILSNFNGNLAQAGKPKPWVEMVLALNALQKGRDSVTVFIDAATDTVADIKDWELLNLT